MTVVPGVGPFAPGAPPALLAAVNACPDRGGVLPHTLQPEGCGRCGELSSCSAGKGHTPGRVTLPDCLACRRAAAP